LRANGSRHLRRGPVTESATYHRQLIREDIRDLADVKHVDDLEILFALLPSKVGAPLSIPNPLRFQKAPGVPAVQLLDRGEGFRQTDPAGYPLLTAPVAHWLPRLP
jgi:hypothetical protein